MAKVMFLSVSWYSAEDCNRRKGRRYDLGSIPHYYVSGMSRVSAKRLDENAGSLRYAENRTYNLRI